MKKCLDEGVILRYDPDKIITEMNRVLAGVNRRGTCPSIWDARAEEPIVQLLTGGLYKCKRQ